MNCVNDKKLLVSYSWFALTSPKIQIKDFLTKFLHNVNNPVLKSRYTNRCKVTAAQSLETLYTFILQQECWWAKENATSPFSHVT